MVDAIHHGRRIGNGLVHLWENAFPVVLGVAAVGASLRWGGDVARFATAHDWKLDQLYVGVFGFLAITTGFLANFYGSIQTMSSGFIGRIRRTQALRSFLRMTKRAIVAGFIMSIASIPMMVINPIPPVEFSWKSAIVAGWLGGSVWAVAGFYRVASYLFFLFEDTDFPPDEPAH